MRRLWELGVLFAVAIACAPKEDTTPSPSPPVVREDFGVLVMAHGGGDEWNAGVVSAIEPLRPEQPIEIAFGMADAVTMQQAVHELELDGAKRIAVVRLFVSGESWFERTEQILGVKAGAPARVPVEQPASHAHHGHSMEFWRIDTDAAFAISTAGLAEADEMGPILADRAAALSKDPSREDVLVLAHGPGDDAENDRWLAQLDTRAEAVRARLPFRRVEVMTLREDWPEKRVEAEQRIRAFVERAGKEEGHAIVIPFRVHGFGPYEGVLEGLEYRADGHGLIPHANVTAWIDRQIDALRDGPFRDAAAE